MTDIDTTSVDPADEITMRPVRRSAFLEPKPLAIAAVLFLSLWIWREVMMRVARENARSQEAEITRLQTENELLTQQLERSTGELSGLASVHVETIQLSGEGSAKVFLDAAEKRANAFFYNLPATKKNEAYHLWFAGGAAPFDGGTFTIGKRGRASLSVTNIPEGAREIYVTTGAADGARILSTKH
jgi:hypothetical protein